MESEMSDQDKNVPTVLLNDGNDEIVYPEVEPLPPPRLKMAEAKGDTPRQKFIAISMRVMTKLAMGENPLIFNYTPDDLKHGRIPEFEKRAEDQKRRDKEKANAKPVLADKKNTQKKTQGHVVWGKSKPSVNQYVRDKNGTLRRQATDTKMKQGTKKTPQAVGGGNKFASLVRLARFKKMTSGKGEKQEEEEEQEPPEEVPKNPRFCATLSAEAQYAMLKGYEDVLLDTFDTLYTDRQKSLFRVKTPHRQVNCLYLANEQTDEVKETEKIREETFMSETLPPTPIPTSNATGFQKDQNRLPDISPSSGLHKTTSLVGKLNSHSAQNYLQVNPQKFPKEKQIRLTMRFQKAQDILDTVRLSQGSLVTSPRATKFVENKRRKKRNNPMDHYNDWSHTWSKEFKLHYGMGGHNSNRVQ